MKISRIKKSTGGGFTVIEAIMSFSILTLALAGFSGMVVSSIQSFRASEARYVAAKIAQEGMELAQNKKDDHVQCVVADPSCPLDSSPIASDDWQKNLVGDWQVESTRTDDLLPTGQFLSFASGNYLCTLKPPGAPATSAGEFGYCGNSVAAGMLTAKYTREVKISRLDDHTVSVVTTVKWGGNQTLVLQSIIFSSN